MVVDDSMSAAVVLREEGWEGLMRHLKDGTTLDQALKETENAIRKAVVRDILVGRGLRGIRLDEVVGESA